MHLHKYSRGRNLLDKWPLIDFCVVSPDFFLSVLDVRVKKGAELSTDHHMVVGNSRLEKPPGAALMRRAS